MTSREHKSLADHYHAKYRGQQGMPPEVARREHPRDRFEAAVRWAKPGGRVLDIGAGHGNVVRALRSNYDSCVLTELSRPRCESLQQIFADDDALEIIEHNIDAEALPFSDGSFDMVIFLDVVEHLVEPIQALRDIRRVIKPGGELFIATPNIAKWTRRIKLLLGYFPSTASKDEGLRTERGEMTSLHDEGHLHYFTFRSLEKILCEHAGFSSTRRRAYGRHGLLASGWPTMFSDVGLTAIK